MKILFLEWDAFANNYIKNAMRKLGHEILVFDFPRRSEDTRRSEELAKKITKKIFDCSADALFSINYFPVAAVAAYACKIKYISWIYDSPYIQLYSKTIDLPTNLAFIFDKTEYLRLQKIGVSTVYYLPMAADTDYYDSITISEKEKEFYSADVAMIGSMYTEKKHDFMRHLKNIDEYTSGYLSGLMNAQKMIYGASILENGITPQIMQNVRKVCPIEALGDGYETAEWVFSNYFLARQITAMERTEYLEALSKQFKVSLYTPEETYGLNVVNKGQVEYYKDAPKAIKCAKINLNITLRSIVSGIPLRAMDIMGCGGFLLTNYQADFDDYFVPGKDYQFFESKQDLIEKTAYYLEHDDIRCEIAHNGYKKIKEAHTYIHRIKQILSMI